MPKRKQYTNEFYKQALLGTPGADNYKGLRSYAKGFEAKDGFNLRDIENWTSHQKRKVREYAQQLHEYTARQNIVVRPKSNATLRKLQEAGQHTSGYPAFKVAFIPYTPDRKEPTKRPKLRITNDKVIISTGSYDRIEYAFNKRKLARAPSEEITNILLQAELDGIRRFAINAGKFLIPQIRDPETLHDEIINLIHKYDGANMVRGKKAGWNPKHHRWTQWLDGVTGYRFESEEPSSTKVKELLRDMEAQKAKRRKSSKKRK